LEEEYAMQLSWQTDYDKLTFIACHPLSGPASQDSERGSNYGIVSSQGYDAPEKMIGDVNLFLRLAYELDGEGEEMLNRPYVRGEIELMIASPSDQGRGFGKATLLAFLQYIKNHTVDILDQYKSHSPDGIVNQVEHQDVKMGGLVLVSKINKTNVKSRSLFESVGFGQVGKEDYFGEIELKLSGGVDGLKPVDGWCEVGYQKSGVSQQ
jgi:GNAT superfamily N-acetyltransferase